VPARLIYWAESLVESLISSAVDAAKNEKKDEGGDRVTIRSGDGGESKMGTSALT
jgi:hypothetical protein